MLLNVTIKPKLIAAFLLVGLVPFATMGFVALSISGSTIESQAFQKLTAVGEIKKNSIERYFATVRDQVLTMSEDRMIIDSMREFSSAFKSFRQENGLSDKKVTTMGRELETYYTSQFAPEYEKQNKGSKPAVESLFMTLHRDTIALQYHYIQANENPIGEKHKLDAASDKSTYSKVHAKYHPAIRSFLEKFGYYDIFLVDVDTGNIVYSVFKELDFATSLLTGPYSDTNFADAFKKARKLTEPDQLVFTDFKQYLPSYNAPASFIASPIIEAGKTTGVLMFQMPIDRVSNVMAERAGLGKTGETYLVGSDNLMRSDSYLDPLNRSVVSSFRNPANGKVETTAVRDALAGKTGAEIILDYRGTPVLSVFSPVDILGTKWAILSEIDKEEAFAAETLLIRLMLLLGIVGALLVGLCGYWIARGFATPIASMSKAMGELANGNLDVEIPAQSRNDEIGEMAAAAQKFAADAIEKAELEKFRADTARRAEANKKKTLQALADEFDSGIGGIIESVSSASAELNGTAQTMSSISEQTNDRATAVAGASEEAASSVHSVATAAEQMADSISEINRQMTQASEASKEAVESVVTTSSQIERLAETTDQIGGIVKMISEIAEQTNLLALNATIESARAGDAGKGFAVVAGEVKELANQTATATESINQEIEQVQAMTQQAVASMSDIKTVIDKLDTTSTAIASALEQQGATTQEISRNVQEAATGTGEVTRNIEGVTQATQEAGAASNQVTVAAGKLSQQSESLRENVSQFLDQIRAA